MFDSEVMYSTRPYGISHYCSLVQLSYVLKQADLLAFIDMSIQFS